VAGAASSSSASADKSKLVGCGNFPLRGRKADSDGAFLRGARLVKLGGQPRLPRGLHDRQRHLILDVHAVDRRPVVAGNRDQSQSSAWSPTPVCATAAGCAAARQRNPASRPTRSNPSSRKHYCDGGDSSSGSCSSAGTRYFSAGPLSQIDQLARFAAKRPPAISRCPGTVAPPVGQVTTGGLAGGFIGCKTSGQSRSAERCRCASARIPHAQNGC